MRPIALIPTVFTCGIESERLIELQVIIELRPNDNGGVANVIVE